MAWAAEAARVRGKVAARRARADLEKRSNAVHPNKKHLNLKTEIGCDNDENLGSFTTEWLGPTGCVGLVEGGSA